MHLIDLLVEHGYVAVFFLIALIGIGSVILMMLGIKFILKWNMDMTIVFLFITTLGFLIASYLSWTHFNHFDGTVALPDPATIRPYIKASILFSTIALLNCISCWIRFIQSCLHHVCDKK